MTILFGFAFSLFFILTGIYIGRKGIVNFIAGYQEGSIEDEKRLAKRIGFVIIAFGLETFILVLLHHFFLPIEAYYIGILAILNVLIILALFIQARM